MMLQFDPTLTPDNKLLAALPHFEYQRLASHLRPIKLPFAEVLYEVGDTVHRVYF
jgi:hypothetical protein